MAESRLAQATAAAISDGENHLRHAGAAPGLPAKKALLRSARAIAKAQTAPAGTNRQRERKSRGANRGRHATLRELAFQAWNKRAILH
jgi:hypothetical protein